MCISAGVDNTILISNHKGFSAFPHKFFVFIKFCVLFCMLCMYDATAYTVYPIQYSTVYGMDDDNNLTLSMCI